MVVTIKTQIFIHIYHITKQEVNDKNDLCCENENVNILFDNGGERSGKSTIKP